MSARCECLRRLPACLPSCLPSCLRWARLHPHYRTPRTPPHTTLCDPQTSCSSPARAAPGLPRAPATPLLRRVHAEPPRLFLSSSSLRGLRCRWDFIRSWQHRYASPADDVAFQGADDAGFLSCNCARVQGGSRRLELGQLFSRCYLATVAFQADTLSAEIPAGANQTTGRQLYMWGGPFRSRTTSHQSLGGARRGFFAHSGRHQASGPSTHTPAGHSAICSHNLFNPMSSSHIVRSLPLSRRLSR